MPPIALLFTSPLLAQAAATADKIDANNPVFAYAVGAVVIGALITAVTVMDKIDSMMERRRRKPSLDVDLVGLQSSINTLNTTVADLKLAKDNHNGHRERIIALETRCAELKTQLEHEIASQRSFQARNTREIFERIEADSKALQASIGALSSTINKEFITLYRALGKVEGGTHDERG
jgi:hypothetical protein